MEETQVDTPAKRGVVLEPFKYLWIAVDGGKRDDSGSGGGLRIYGERQVDVDDTLVDTIDVDRRPTTINGWLKVWFEASLCSDTAEQILQDAKCFEQDVWLAGKRVAYAEWNAVHKDWEDE